MDDLTGDTTFLGASAVPLKGEKKLELITFCVLHAAFADYYLPLSCFKSFQKIKLTKFSTFGFVETIIIHSIYSSRQTKLMATL